MGLENPIHLMIVLLVVLLVFGAKRLPDMGRSMGEGMRGFKQAISGEAPSTAHLAAVTSHQADATTQTVADSAPVVSSQPSLVP
ncbi:MAG TPA: twin-arginine translocase TatA/TatE family subunit [Solirubrobacteraceae bacterium]|jgi:sec-independent protein translocase protein TatA|nr:twin-arginine translocase TatA/TatE family subunit [Solirubrobacteraceae bacterium]